MSRALRIIALLLAGLAASACGDGQPRFNATDITGASFGSGFALKGHDGRDYGLKDFRGKAVALFFGYTQCPDVCPTTMTTMAEAMRLLGADAAQVQVIFVTLDPERDTQALLAEYVPQFDKSFLGLRGDKAATEAVAKEFKVYYTKQPGGAGGYTLDHTAGTYIFDPQGRLRLYVKHGEAPPRIADDLRLLLAGK
jgi:protein SCO1/2